MLIMRTDALVYTLPPELLATTAAEPRDSARLMVINRTGHKIAHHHVRDLPKLGLLRPGDLLVVNQTRVLPAYFTATRTHTGGKVTGLYLESTPDGAWRFMAESRGKLQPGETLTFNNDQTITLARSLGQGTWEGHTDADLYEVGQTPLPPYIQKARKSMGLDSLSDEDAKRYNTVYAQHAGSVAAPTAGLHFTKPLLKAIEAMGVQRACVTLHVGVGTFVPVRTDTLGEHAMHHERIVVPIETIELLRQTRANGGRIIPVGTTTIRALESLPEPITDLTEDYATETNLFIYPNNPDFQGFRFADQVMTNFHLPRSTLLAMIATLPNVGLDRLMQWYAAAIEERYRFYSYGDAMWIG